MLFLRKVEKTIFSWKIGYFLFYPCSLPTKVTSYDYYDLRYPNRVPCNRYWGVVSFLCSRFGQKGLDTPIFSCSETLKACFEGFLVVISYINTFFHHSYATRHDMMILLDQIWISVLKKKIWYNHHNNCYCCTKKQNKYRLDMPIFSCSETLRACFEGFLAVISYMNILFIIHMLPGITWWYYWTNFSVDWGTLCSFSWSFFVQQ